MLESFAYIELGDGSVDRFLVELAHDGHRVGVAPRLGLGRDVDGDLLNPLNLGMRVPRNQLVKGLPQWQQVAFVDLTFVRAPTSAFLQSSQLSPFILSVYESWNEAIFSEPGIGARLRGSRIGHGPPLSGGS